MEFVKAHGTGNDFVLLPDPGDTFALTTPFVRALCDRHRGLGADGVIRMAPAGESADVFMDYRNADGSVAEMCGNGVRCVAKYVADRWGVAGGAVAVATRAGVKHVRILERHPDGTVARVEVDMGPPAQVETASRPVGGRPTEVTTLSMGNPHAVIVTDDVEAAPLAAWARELNEHADNGINVEVIEVVTPTHVRGRVLERGVGETLASGTGASAMAVAAHARGLADRTVTVSVPGGDLAVRWTDGTVVVAGPAEEVAAGRLDERWLAGAQLRQAEQPA